MDRNEFDKFADEYRALHTQNIGVTGELPDYFVEYKVRDIYNQIRATGDLRDNLRILDFGGGVGSAIPFYRQYFPSCQVVCADVSWRSLDLAMGRFGESASYTLFDGETLPLESGVFDIAFAACVFHHVPMAEHIALLRELRRVLSNNSGRLFLYEHNPLNPLTVYAVSTCVFDRDAVLIPSWKMRRQFQEAGYLDIAVRYRVFFPRFLAFLRFLEFRMSWLPFGAQYCVAGRVSNADEHRGQPNSE
jgi:ubiquinone/menaquinone biosynthesis C-methylase UbiE